MTRADKIRAMDDMKLAQFMREMLGANGVWQRLEMIAINVGIHGLNG